MPRGDNPNSRANLNMSYGGKGGFDTESARKAKELSDKAKAINKSLNADLKERCTPERIAKMNDRIMQMAEHGNLKAYELIRDGLGEKPTDKVNLSVEDESARAIDDYFADKYNKPTGE